MSVCVYSFVTYVKNFKFLFKLENILLQTYV